MNVLLALFLACALAAPLVFYTLTPPWLCGVLAVVYFVLILKALEYPAGGERRLDREGGR